MAFVSLAIPVTNVSPFASSFITTRRARAAPLFLANRRSVSTLRAMADGGEPSSSTDTPATVNIPYEPDQISEVIIDDNIAGFCSVDPTTGKKLELSMREKENLFLDAMQAFFRGQTTLSNEEFDALKEELTWQGSEVVTLSRDEFTFLDAAKAYEQGKPTMDDVEFDKLKTRLFEQGSVVAIQRGPRCSIERKITFSDIIQDKKRTLALYAPAGVVFALTWLSLAFELTPLHKIDPVLSLIIGSPIIFIAARLFTSLIVPEAQIMVGDCPSCGRRTHVLFGNVLNQVGFEAEADVKCDKCKAKLKVDKPSGRMILMEQ